MNNLKDLQIWSKAIDLAREVYLMTKKFPVEEKYGMISQLQRSSSSIPANISEGAGRNSKKEFVHFLAVANGSSYELETFLVLAHDVGYIDKEIRDTLLEMNNHVIRMNFKLQMSLRKT